MTMRETILQKLTASLAPSALEIEDESARHAGHSGSRPGGETHFSVRIVSTAFEGLTRVQRQRLVYKSLAQEMKGAIHALALTTLTPHEALAPPPKRMA